MLSRRQLQGLVELSAAAQWAHCFEVSVDFLIITPSSYLYFLLL